jgi:hypothetical protein
MGASFAIHPRVNHPGGHLWRRDTHAACDTSGASGGCADPDHEGRDDLRSRAGEAFDPAGFDLGSVNTRLQRVR